MSKKSEDRLIEGITGVRIHPTIPMHMIDEIGHMVPTDELPITPHQTTYNTPAASPVLRGTAERAVAEELNRRIDEIQLFNPYILNTAPILFDSKTIISHGAPMEDDELKSIASQPVPRNPVNSPADTLSEVLSTGSFKSIQSWPIPRNPLNSPMVGSPALSDVDKHQSPAANDFSDVSETPGTSEQSPIPSSHPPPPAPMPTAIASPADLAASDGTDGGITLTGAGFGPPQNPWQLGQHDDTELSHSYGETAQEGLKQMLDAASTEAVKEKLIDLKTSLQEHRYDGDKRLVRYGAMLAELSKVVSQADLIKKRRAWNMLVDGGLAADGIAADKETIKETCGMISLLHEQTVKRAQDLARAQRIVEEKLLLIEKQ